MLPQAKAEFHVKPVAGNRYQVQDRNLHNRGTFATRLEADAHLATLTTARPQTRRTLHHLAQAAQPLLIGALALALLVAQFGPVQAAPVKACRWVQGVKICRYVNGGSGITPPVLR